MDPNKAFEEFCHRDEPRQGGLDEALETIVFSGGGTLLLIDISNNQSLSSAPLAGVSFDADTDTGPSVEDWARSRVEEAGTNLSAQSAPALGR